MHMLFYFLGILLTVSTGYLVLKLIFCKQESEFTLWELLLYSFLFGSVMIPFLLFVLGRMKIPLSQTILLSSILVINFIGYARCYWKKARIPTNRCTLKTERNALSKWRKWGIVIMIFRVIVKVVYGMISLSAVPTYQDDTFVNWNYRAKVFYTQESLVLDKKSDDYLWDGFTQYPMTVSLYKTFLAKMAGVRDEWLVNLPAGFWYIASLLLIFFALWRSTKSFLRGVIGATVLSWIPLFYIHGTNPYTDIQQGIYVFLPVFFLFLFLKEKREVFLTMGIVSLAYCSLIKNEGLMIYGTIIAVLGVLLLLLYHKWIERLNISIKKILLSSRIGRLPALIFVGFKVIYGLGFWNGDMKITESSITYNPEIWKAISTAIFMEGNYNILWILGVGILVWFLRYIRKSFKEHFSLLSIFLILFSIMFAFIVLYLFVPSLHREALSQTGVNRTAIQIMLLLVFSIILLFYKYIEER